MKKFYKQTKNTHGSYTPPLFDRLTQQGTRMLTAEEVKQSVRCEVENLLNTRFVLSKGRMEDEDVDLGGYPLVEGFEDLSSSLTENPDAFAQRVKDVVLAYEPRLAELDVILVHEKSDQGVIQVQLKGALQLGDKRVLISFPVDMTMD